MNIEGNKVVWQYKNYYITFYLGKYNLYKYKKHENHDGTAFCSYELINTEYNIEDLVALCDVF